MDIAGIHDLFFTFQDRGVLQNIRFLKEGCKGKVCSDRVESRANVKVLLPAVPASLGSRRPKQTSAGLRGVGNPSVFLIKGDMVACLTLPPWSPGMLMHG